MRRLSPLVAALAIAVAAGCGGEKTVTPEPETVEGTVPQETAPVAGEGDPAAGKDVYASAGCGGCHTYEAGGSTGTVGPNLDESDVDFADAAEQVANGGGGMPAFKDRLSEKEIADVAAFVTEGGS